MYQQTKNTKGKKEQHTKNTKKHNIKLGSITAYQKHKI